MNLSGAEIVLKCLKEQNVDTIFGYPGGAVIPLYDALYDYKDDFLHILTSHEQGAVHGADGYARSTGKVGVCFATSGPGATNTITGIATAYMDSVPIIVFTGQVPQSLLGRDSFQEIDITAVTFPVTKYNYLVKNIEDLAPIIREAFEIAQNGRPGPILIDIPKDIFISKCQYSFKAPKKEKKKEENIDKDKLVNCSKLIDTANKPIIYAGGGIIHAQAEKELMDFAQKGQIPVANTLMSLGSFPMEHPLSLGLVGMHGHKETNLAVMDSDLVIAIGARFSDRVIGADKKFAPKAKIIHIDIDSSEIGKNKEVDIPFEGNVKQILRELTNKIAVKDRSAWLKKIKNNKTQHFKAQSTFTAKNILEMAQQIIGKNTIIVTEVGQHQMWAAQYCKINTSRRFLTSGGLGTMGYGLGAAIGAQIGNPDKKVLHLAGDGCFRMNCNELATVNKYNLPIITLLFNNGSLGMVRQWQELFQEERYSETDLTDDVNYLKLANAYSLKGEKVRTLEELRLALNRAVKSDKATIIECIIDKFSGVYPIVPAGKPINEMIIK